MIASSLGSALADHSSFPARVRSEPSDMPAVGLSALISVGAGSWPPVLTVQALQEVGLADDLDRVAGGEEFLRLGLFGARHRAFAESGGVRRRDDEDVRRPGARLDRLSADVG